MGPTNYLFEVLPLNVLRNVLFKTKFEINTLMLLLQV